ncbi:MAG: alpha/beta fold hydrolase, partial [Pseudomonadota bacterium]
MSHLVKEGLFKGFDVFAWDARGHGKSHGARGFAPDVATLVRDLDGFSRHITDKSGVDLSDCVLVGQSVGAVIAASWVHDYAPNIRAMILAAPAFRVNLFLPFALQGLAVWKALFGDFTVKSYVRPRMLSQDQERIESYDADCLVTRDISSSLLLDLFRTGDRIARDAAA